MEIISFILHLFLFLASFLLAVIITYCSITIIAIIVWRSVPFIKRVALRLYERAVAFARGAGCAMRGGYFYLLRQFVKM